MLMQKNIIHTTLLLLSVTIYAQDSVADALCNLGNALYKEGNITRAQEQYTQALERCPDHPQAILQLGTLYFEQKHYNKAQPYLEKRVAQQPTDEEAAIMLAHCSLWQKQYPQATQQYTRILAVNPRRIDLYLYRAQCYKKQHNFIQALSDIEHFLATFPKDYQAQLIKAYILEQIGEYEHALNIFKSLPQSHKILAAQAHVHKAIGNADTAIDLYKKAHAQAPDQRSYLLGLSYSYLLAGDSINGYTTMKEYLCSHAKRPRFLDNTHNIAGKRILIGAEILLDNMIQHVRFAQCIKEHAGITIVQSSEPLLNILSACPMIDELVSTTQQAPSYDYHIPAILLPWLFEQYAPETVPYLKAHPRLAEQWSSQLPQNGKKNIGICWHLQETLHSPAEQRIIATEQLTPLFTLDTYNFLALYHKNHLPDFTPLKSPDHLITLCGSGFSESPDEMASLLALIDTLDAIITIDTTIAHLAGALGKPTYLLLPYHTNWRWGLDRSDSPWYPTITILRQCQIGSWKEPIEQLVAALKTSS